MNKTYKQQKYNGNHGLMTVCCKVCLTICCILNIIMYVMHYLRTDGDISQLSNGGWGLGRVLGGQVGCCLITSSFGESFPSGPRSLHTHGGCVHSEHQCNCRQAPVGRTYAPPGTALHQTDAHDERLLQPTQAYTEPGGSGWDESLYGLWFRCVHAGGLSYASEERMAERVEQRRAGRAGVQDVNKSRCAVGVLWSCHLYPTLQQQATLSLLCYLIGTQSRTWGKQLRVNTQEEKPGGCLGFLLLAE